MHIRQRVTERGGELAEPFAIGGLARRRVVVDVVGREDLIEGFVLTLVPERVDQAVDERLVRGGRDRRQSR